jgi:hypothetical protein
MPNVQTAKPRCLGDPLNIACLVLLTDRKTGAGPQGISEVIHFLFLLLLEIGSALSTERPQASFSFVA